MKTACELMEKLGVPKQEICYLICERAQEWEFSEGYLRRLVPNEYKNQMQRDIRLTHEGEPIGSPAQTTTIQINSEEDIQPIHKDPISTSTSTPKKISTYAQQLKSERDEAREELRAFRLKSGVTFVYECLMKEIPEPELGKKVKEYFLKDKWYLKWLKEENLFNVKGKTREEAYLNNLNKMVEEQDRKEKQKAVKAEKKSVEKSKPTEPKDISKVYKNKNHKKNKETFLNVTHCTGVTLYDSSNPVPTCSISNILCPCAIAFSIGIDCLKVTENVFSPASLSSTMITLWAILSLVLPLNSFVSIVDFSGMNSNT